MITEKTSLFGQFRRELHQFPELSGKEVATRERIKAIVSQFQPTRSTEVAETGLLVQYGLDTAGPITLIRADIDALPIQEANAFTHRSEHEGVSHQCGHDGHTAILVRLASLLTENPPVSGKVYLLFQPAEETGKGAESVLADPIMAAIQPDRVFALHNLPGYPAGMIVCKPGPFTASVLSMIVTFTGKVSHAAEPEKGLNPAYAMAEFMLTSRAFQQPNPQSDDFALITPVYTTMGSRSYGVSAGYGEVHLTLRTRTANRMETLKTQLLALLNTLSAQRGVAITTEYTEAFAATENDPEAFDEIRQSAQELGFPFAEMPEPFKWGEDFGLFTQKYKGAMFGIGAGEESPALHNDTYDFNDNLIEPAAHLFLLLITRRHTETIPGFQHAGQPVS